MINLKLVYFTPSVHWLPRYTLDIRKDGDAVLCLQALVSQRLPWNDSIRSVSNCFVEPANEHALDVRGARREEHAPGQLPTSFAKHTWILASRYAPGLAMGPACIADCVVNVDPEDQMLSSWLRATMNATRAWSLPAGIMQITRHGDLIESARMPLWNPGQDLIIKIESTSRGPAWDPCRIRCLLNESVSERHSSQYHVQITTEAGDQAGALGYASNRQALDPDINNGSLRGSQERHLRLTERNLDRHTALQEQISDGGRMGRDRLSTSETHGDRHPSEDETDAAMSLLSARGQDCRTAPLNKVLTSKECSANPPREAVALKIFTKWNTQTSKWAYSRGGWETSATDEVSQIEVYLADSLDPGARTREPIHLTPWTGAEWRGRLCNGHSLHMAVDEVMRLTRVGGMGRGILVHYRTQRA